MRLRLWLALASCEALLPKLELWLDLRTTRGHCCAAKFSSDRTVCIHSFDFPGRLRAPDVALRELYLEIGAEIAEAERCGTAPLVTGPAHAAQKKQQLFRSRPKSWSRGRGQPPSSLNAG